MKCLWDIHQIYDKLEVLENLYYEESDEEKKDIIIRDAQAIKKYIINHEENYFIPNEPKFLDIYENKKKDLMDIHYLKDDFITFDKLTNEQLPCLPEIKKCSLSNKDILDITYDFYQNLSPYYFRIFNQFFSSSRNHIIFNPYNESYTGESFPINSLKEAFVEINKLNTLEDILTTIHEYSHVISSFINPYQLSKSKSLFIEIDSQFMELIANDYLKDIFQSDSLTIIKALNHKFRYVNANNFHILYKIMSLEENNKFSNNKEFKNMVEQSLKIPKHVLEKIIYANSITPTVYLTSYIFAIELYELYKKDKDKALYFLKKITLLNKENPIDYYNSIKKMGIIPNEHLEEFHNNILDETYNLIRKRKNNTIKKTA